MINFTVLLGLLASASVADCRSEADILASYPDASQVVISERLDHLMETGSNYYMHMMQEPKLEYDHVHVIASTEARYYLMIDKNGCTVSVFRLPGIES